MTIVESCCAAVGLSCLVVVGFGLTTWLDGVYGRLSPGVSHTCGKGDMPSQSEMEVMALEVRIARAVVDLRQYLAKQPSAELDRIVCVLSGELPRDHSSEVWEEFVAARGREQATPSAATVAAERSEAATDGDRSFSSNQENKLFPLTETKHNGQWRLLLTLMLSCQS